MKLLVCGGRDYDDQSAVAWELNRYAMQHDDLAIICGYDPDDRRFQGADQLAFEWAVRMKVPVFPFPAPWKLKGRAAGPIRNRRMRDWGRPDAALAFPGGRGTADMCAALETTGIIAARVPSPTHPADVARAAVEGEGAAPLTPVSQNG